MIEIFYAMLLVVFGALIVVAGTRYFLSANLLREELRLHRERRDQQEARLAQMKTELGDSQLDTELLEIEVEVLQQRELCMRSLDQLNADAAADAAGGEGEA